MEDKNFSFALPSHKVKCSLETHLGCSSRYKAFVASRKGVLDDLPLEPQFRICFVPNLAKQPVLVGEKLTSSTAQGSLERGISPAHFYGAR